jgi:hypothetical protein
MSMNSSVPGGANTAENDGWTELPGVYVVQQAASEVNSGKSSTALEGLDVHWNDAGKVPPQPLQVLNQNGQQMEMRPPPMNQSVQQMPPPSSVPLPPSQMTQMSPQPVSRQPDRKTVSATASAETPVHVGAAGLLQADAVGGAAGFCLPEGLLIDPIVAMEALRKTSG